MFRWMGCLRLMRTGGSAAVFAVLRHVAGHGRRQRLPAPGQSPGCRRAVRALSRTRQSRLSAAGWPPRSRHGPLPGAPPGRCARRAGVAQAHGQRIRPALRALHRSLPLLEGPTLFSATTVAVMGPPLAISSRMPASRNTLVSESPATGPARCTRGEICCPGSRPCRKCRRSRRPETLAAGKPLLFSGALSLFISMGGVPRREAAPSLGPAGVPLPAPPGPNVLRGGAQEKRAR